MANNTSTRKKRKVPISHRCSQKDVISRISHLLIGNGTPEDGLAFKFALFMKDHDTIVSNIKEIKDGVAGLHTKAEQNALAAATAMHAIEKYKAEMEGVEKGGNKVVIEKSKKFNNILKTIGTVVAILALCLTATFGAINIFKQDRTIEKVENLGEPVVTNPRGVPIPLPIGAEIKYFPRDFDSTKTDSVNKLGRIIK